MLCIPCVPYNLCKLIKRRMEMATAKKAAAKKAPAKKAAAKKAPAKKKAGCKK